MKIAVVTSCYGEYDPIRPPTPQDVDCEFVLVTDKPVDCPPWRVVVEPRPQLHPRLAAKVAKCFPHKYAHASAYVWVDAAFEINSHDFVSWAISHTEHGPLAMIPHPQRSRITDEAEASWHLEKYAGLPVREQAAHYIRCGHPDDWGLWAAGIMVRRENRLPHDFGERWLAEQVRWTYQDQISLPAVLYSYGIKPTNMDARLHCDSHFVWHGHRSAA